LSRNGPGGQLRTIRRTDAALISALDASPFAARQNGCRRSHDSGPPPLIAGVFVGVLVYFMLMGSVRWNSKT
jgi:hypothetical protein